ncbi:nucleotidyltransferase domain-containing protein [Nocardioides insulae]|uniref:nucleotidyltransferase domain-containing protein n=1 Tax=Nocardioides insulae TaxID=394734 RepID=UPI0003FAE103|nr:nucleotidyltransferase [Nocardioides insulae]
MKRTVDNSFTKLDENLNLDPFVRLKAQNLHNTIRDDLTKAGLIAGSFLQGSFARKTMLKPLKDVDIVCLLPADLWEQLRGPDGPGRAMESFKAPIVDRWPDVQFDVGDEPSGKALRLTLSDVDFTIDLVPAFDTDNDYVLIGDRFEGTWELSNTRIQLKRVSDRNQATNGRFVHQVREVKALSKHHEELDFVSGIVVESLAYAAIGRKMLDKDAVAAVLEYAKDAVKGPVLEPAGEDDVTIKWTSEERETAARVYAEASRKAAEALRLERAGDMDGAISVWHSLFGDVFPDAPARPVLDVMTAFAAGSVSSAGRPSTTTVAQQAAAPGRSWTRGPDRGEGSVIGQPGTWLSR